MRITAVGSGGSLQCNDKWCTCAGGKASPGVPRLAEGHSDTFGIRAYRDVEWPIDLSERADS
jgi:hypothetical protein